MKRFFEVSLLIILFFVMCAGFVIVALWKFKVFLAIMIPQILIAVFSVIKYFQKS
jgi:hypothetical protein